MEEEDGLTPRQRIALAQGGSSATAQTDVSNSGSFESDLSGVHGWLGFLAISLVALGPVVTLIMTGVQHIDAESLYPSLVGTSLWQKAVLLDWIIAAAYSAISIFAGFRLLKAFVPSTVPIVIGCLWLSGPGLGIAGLLLANNLSPTGATASDAGASVGRPLIYATVWTIYLLRSRRVKNTYGIIGARSDLGEGRRISLNKKTRQFLFLTICWIVLSSLYFLLFATRRELAYGPNPWAVIFLPPLLLAVGWWIYARFVDGPDKE